MIMRAILRFLMRIAFRMQVEGKESVPSQGGVILAANHLSGLDPIVVGCALDRRVRFMAKHELFDNPILGFLIRSLGAFPVRRGKDDKDAFRTALEVLRSGEVLGIFPEGTRSAEGRLQKAYSGAAVLAEKTGAYLVPVGIIGTDKIMRKGAFLPKAGRVIVRFGEPIIPAEVCSSATTDRPSFNPREAITNRMMEEIARLVVLN
ncbi:MAG TPA: lysophospholipid acyltransferase family protein [Bacillota bacterium]|nr:lysophospholipid acyltransferase family protein [Bacillota bacterium]HOB88057.1 lysophospholipid acyltransferase family protein [Bacillota bacterium]HOJ57067.1 lysophospholipid acyltransferase family protein [Bacillota bacterium]HOL01629.1 lysophospholipid acyltransferase family protein [Bacillota bacterium]HPO79888.1 lysophospholipid acyltransferase family protein [Bacillota bacterium]